MRLYREDEDGEPLYAFTIPWKKPYWMIKSRIFNYLDRDSKHAIICKIIHRHKRPSRTIEQKACKTVDDALNAAGAHFAAIVHDGILENLGVPWNCVRCGKKQELKLSIDIDSISKWKDYTKIVDMPYLKFNSIKVPGPGAYGPMPSPEPTNLSNIDLSGELFKDSANPWDKKK